MLWNRGHVEGLR